MKSNISKIAASLIIVAGLIGFIVVFNPNNGIGAAHAFDRITSPFFTTRSFIFKITVKVEGIPEQTAECMFMEPDFIHQSFPGGEIHIAHLNEGRSITLDPEHKKAVLSEIKNPREYRNGDQFFEIKKIIQQARQSDEESVKYLGEKQIGGLNALGYQINGSPWQITVWGDAEKLRPIRIEFGTDNTIGPEAGFIMHDFIFDVDLDESDFSLDPPPGYTVISKIRK